MSSPKTSSCRWETAALPTRTGRESSYPGSYSSSRSSIRRSPVTPYRIRSFAGTDDRTDEPFAPRASFVREADVQQ